jgi:hypothetical protein
LHSDGGRFRHSQLAQLDQLTTVQTSIQPWYSWYGDTVHWNFGEGQDEEKRSGCRGKGTIYLVSLLQVHAMLCVSVVERNRNGGTQ